MNYGDVIEVPLPVSTNASRSYKRNKKRLAECLSCLIAGNINSSARLALSLVYRFPPDKRKRDLLNYDKELVDELCRALGIDDSQFDRVILERGEPADPPCVEVMIDLANP